MLRIESVALFTGEDRNMTELVLGSVPRGPDYFGQQQFIESLWQALEKDSVLLVAPRRFGKLMDAPREGFHPIYVNVEHLSSAANFMVEILALLLRDHHLRRVVGRLWEGAKDFSEWIRNIPASVDMGGVKVELREKTDVRDNWLSYGERIMGLLAQEEPRLLLMIDEFPIMVSGMLQRDRSEAEQFLRWFRTVRTAPDTRTRFIIGGSTNIMYALENSGLVDTINDLHPAKLRPFDSETAAQYLQAVFSSRNIPLDDDVQAKILDLVGEPIPYLLALLVQFVLERSQAEDGAMTPELVERAFNEDLLGGGPAVLLHYWSRLREYYPAPEEAAAKAILSILSRTEDTVMRDTLYHAYLRATGAEPGNDTKESFIRLMWKLDNDFYVVSRADGYAFFSRVLKLWWIRCYGYQEE